jgi:hypothetical protein
MIDSQTFQKQEDLIVLSIYFHKLSRAALTLSYVTQQLDEVCMEFIIGSRCMCNKEKNQRPKTLEKFLCSLPSEVIS